jgi:hypothetical protein
MSGLLLIEDTSPGLIVVGTREGIAEYVDFWPNELSPSGAKTGEG